jgi:hypothetical protein
MHTTTSQAAVACNAPPSDPHAIDYLGKTKNAAARARAEALPGGVEAANAALNTPARLTKGSL